MARYRNRYTTVYNFKNGRIGLKGCKSYRLSLKWETSPQNAGVGVIFVNAPPLFPKIDLSFVRERETNRGGTW